MNIKKHLPILLLLICAANAHAQDLSPYIILRPVYGFGVNSQEIASNVIYDRNKVKHTKSVYGSYGAGFPPEIGIGKMVNETFGVELNAGYLLGAYD